MATHGILRCLCIQMNEEREKKSEIIMSKLISHTCNILNELFLSGISVWKEQKGFIL